eukprot:jgi/Pico_ML_1/53296/g3867.t1
MNALARPQAAVQARVGRVGGRARPSLAGKRAGAFGNARPSTRKAGLDRAQARADRSVVAMAGKEGEPGNMSYLKVYLSTAPVVSTVFFFVLAAAVIEVNRFFPDALTAAFLSH